MNINETIKKAIELYPDFEIFLSVGCTQEFSSTQAATSVFIDAVAHEIFIVDSSSKDDFLENLEKYAMIGG